MQNTPVIFRKFSDGEVIALFPTLVASYIKPLCMSYMHVGQHGGASYRIVINQTKLAKPEEYAELLAELRAIGYDDLKVYTRRTAKMYTQFMNEFWR